MAVGIASNTTVFTILNAVVLADLPYHAPDRLVTFSTARDGEAPQDEIGVPAVADWAAHSQTIEGLGLWRDTALRITRDGRTELVRGMRVSANYFDLLGVSMQLGRSFRAEDDTPAGRNALILTDATWRALFGGDPRVIGRAVQSVDGLYRVVGVLAADFRPLHMSNPGEFPSVFAPLGLERSAYPCRPCPAVRVVGRLTPGASVAAAQAEVNTRFAQFARQHPADYSTTAVVRIATLREQLVGRFGKAVATAQAVAALFLLLACVNVAALLVAQTARRRADIALRAALGASRARIAGELLTESVLLAACGGVAGVALAWIATRAIAVLGATEIPRLQEVTPDGSLLLAGLATTLASGLLFGVLPAVRASRIDLNPVLKGLEASTNRIPNRAGINVLLAGEVGLAFVLVAAVALLGTSYVNLIRVDAGFDPRHVVTLSLMPDGTQYGTAERRLAYFDAVTARTRQIADVDSAGYASTLPLSHPDAAPLHIREHPPSVEADAPLVDAYLASPDYFRALGIPLLRGRGFSITDRRGTAPVALVSESAARLLFSGDDPIGSHIQLGARDEQQPWATIVGVVRDVRQYGLDVPARPAAYLPFAQAPHVQGWSSLVVRTRVDSDRVEGAVRAALLDVDPLQPIFHLQSMDEYVAKSLAQRTFTLTLVAVCGGFALLLATLGVYGVVSYVTALRAREAAIRLALGAAPASIVAMLGGHAAALAMLAVACGAAIVTVAGRAVSPLLFQVDAGDPRTLGAVATVVLAAACVAAGLPAWRIARRDPLAALRHQ
jgi:predicted permease